MTYSDVILADNPLLYWRFNAAGGSATLSATASEWFPQEPPSNAIDGNAGTNWTTNGNPVAWIRLTMSAAGVKTSYSIKRRDDLPARMPKNWTWEGSNDLTTWAVLDTQVNQTWPTAGETRTYAHANNTAYLYYRLNVTANNGDPSYTSLAELAALPSVPASTTDSSGNGRAPTIVTALPSPGAGLIGTSEKAFVFADGNEVTIPYAAWMSSLSFTVSCLFRTTNLGGNRTLFSRYDSGGNVFTLRQDGASLVFYVYGTRWLTISYPTALVMGTTYHAAVVRNDTDGAVRLYVNGAQVASGVVTGLTDKPAAFSVGRSGVGEWFNGTIDEVAYFGSVLSNNAIAAQYASASAVAPAPANASAAGAASDYLDRLNTRPSLWGAWKLSETSGTTLADSSGNGRGLTLTGTPGRGVGPGGSQSLDWATVGQYAQGPTPAGGAAQTFETWVWLDANPTAQAGLMGTAANPTPGGQNSENSLYVNTDRTVTLYQYNGDWQYITSSSPLTLGAWHHVVGSWTPTGMKLRINKVTVATKAVSAVNYGQRPFFLHGGLNNGGGAVRMAMPSYYLDALSDAETDAGYDTMVAPAVVTGWRGAAFTISENVGLALTPSTARGASATISEYVIQPINSAPVETDSTQVQRAAGEYPDLRGLIPITAAPTVVQIGQLVETDATQAVVFLNTKTVQIGIALEVDSTSRLEAASAQMPWGPSAWTGPGNTPPTAYKWMQAANFSQAPQLGIATEVDSTSALTVVQTSAPQSTRLGIPVETDQALPLTLVTSTPPTVVVIGQPSELDVANAIASKVDRSFPIGLLQDTSTAQALTVISGTVIQISQPVETDAASPLARQIQLRLVTEGDQIPLPVVPRPGAVTTTVSQLVESDQALTLIKGGTSARALGIAAEVDQAQPLAIAVSAISAPIGQASEVETTSGKLGVVFLLGVLAEEGDTAYPLTPVLGPVSLALSSQPQEADQLIGGPLTYTLRYQALLGALGEQDQALPLTKVLQPVVKQVTQLEVIEQANPLSPVLTFTVSLAPLQEQDSTTPLGIIFGFEGAREQDSVGSLTVAATFQMPVSIATEVDQALAMSVRSAITVPISSTPGEVDACIESLALVVALASTLLEQDSAPALTILRRIVVRRVWIAGELRRVTLLGVTDGQGGLHQVREFYWDGERRREFTTEVVEGG